MPSCKMVVIGAKAWRHEHSGCVVDSYFTATFTPLMM